jgi:hypothetical protein
MVLAFSIIASLVIQAPIGCHQDRRRFFTISISGTSPVDTNFISEFSVADPLKPTDDFTPAIVSAKFQEGEIAGGSAYGATVPIPGAVWLLGSGIIGLVFIRRKFKK